MATILGDDTIPLVNQLQSENGLITNVQMSVGLPKIISDLIADGQLGWSDLDADIGVGYAAGNGVVGFEGSFRVNTAESTFKIELAGSELGLGAGLSVEGAISDDGTLTIEKSEAFGGIQVITGNQSEFAGFVIGEVGKVQNGFFVNYDQDNGFNLGAGSKISLSKGLVLGKVDASVSAIPVIIDHKDLTVDNIVDIFTNLYPDINLNKPIISPVLSPLIQYIEYNFGRAEALRALKDHFGVDECFLANTQIDMWPSSIAPRPDDVYDPTEVAAKTWHKPIEDIRPDDVIVSVDEHGRRVPGRVSQTMQNRVRFILDFHGTKVTPGHRYYCAGGRYEGQYVALLDILRSDGAIETAKGEKRRAATGEPVGSPQDRLIWAVTGKRDPKDSGKVIITGKAQIRAGTRHLMPDGGFLSPYLMIQHYGWMIDDEGWLRETPEAEPMPFHWLFTAELPKPEDYILARSDLTLEDIYTAPWEGEHPPHMPAPHAGERGASYMPRHALMQDGPLNIPLSLRGATNPAHKPSPLNRKQRKAMEAKQRKASKTRKRITG